jgi:hypothetical protein
LCPKEKGRIQEISTKGHAEGKSPNEGHMKHHSSRRGDGRMLWPLIMNHFIRTSRSSVRHDDPCGSLNRNSDTFFDVEILLRRSYFR